MNRVNRMTKKREDYMLDLLEDNNRMLRDITRYINFINRRAESENTDDFVRNVIANVVSNILPNNRRK